VIQRDKGFDPFPYSFLFFVLGGIMQSLFVPTMLTASNRSTERDQIQGRDGPSRVVTPVQCERRTAPHPEDATGEGRRIGLLRPA